MSTGVGPLLFLVQAKLSKQCNGGLLIFNTHYQFWQCSKRRLHFTWQLANLKSLMPT